MDASTSRRREHVTCHAERTSLLLRIEEEFDRTGIAFVVAPTGYGKTSFLRDIAFRWHCTHGAHAPVVRIDCASRRSSSFLTTYRRRRAEGSTALVAQSSARVKLKLGDDARTLFPQVCALVPDEPLCQLVWGYVDSMVSEWADAFRNQQRSRMPGELRPPLVLIDNLPATADKERAQFAQLMRRWLASGAKVVIASIPSGDISQAEFPDSLRLPAASLAVSTGELELWKADLHLPDLEDAARQTMGVPALVGACRVLPAGQRPNDDAEFRRRAVRLVRRVHEENDREALKLPMIAMSLLGAGTLGELASLGCSLKPADLSVLARDYPLFAVDLAQGTFHTVCLDVAEAQDYLAGVAEKHPRLMSQCIGVLARAGEVARSVALVRLLPDEVLAQTLGENAAYLLDAVPRDVLEHALALKASYVCLDESAQKGLACLDALFSVLTQNHEMQPDTRMAVCGDGAWNEFLMVWDAISGAWSSKGREVCVGAGEGSLQATLFDASELFDEVPASAARTIPGGISEACTDMARAVVAQDMGKMAPPRKALQCLLGDLRPLPARLICHHVALCLILAGAPEDALTWLNEAGAHVHMSGLEQGSWQPATMTDALLAADISAARVLVERPTSSERASEALNRLRMCRLYLEARGLAGALPWTGMLEALVCALDGRELEVPLALEKSMAAFAAGGNEFGQLTCTFLRMLVELVRGQNGQAAASARSALRLAESLHSRSLIDAARLAETMALWPRRSPAALDARLLEITLRESALAPRTSRALVCERALICCAAGDAEGARVALDEVVCDESAFGMRALGAMVRASGNLRSRLGELVRPEARKECLSLSGRPLPHVSAPPKPALPSDKPLVIRMLGGMQVEVSGHVVEPSEWRRVRSRRLLGLMALRADKPVQRLQAITALWPGCEPELCRDNFNAVLSTLRGVLGQKNGGPHVLDVTNDVLRLNLELVDVDILRFETLARDLLSRREGMADIDLFAACSELERLYRSGLDAEFDLMGADGVSRSEALAGLFADCMVYAAGRALAAHDENLSLWMARCARRACAHREDVALAFMRALRSSSRFSDALSEYRTYCDFEREMYGMTPPASLRHERDSIAAELEAAGVVAIPREIQAEGSLCMGDLVEMGTSGGYALYRQRGLVALQQ